MPHNATRDFENDYTYTRAHALADGLLIDATDLAREIGFLSPVMIDQIVQALAPDQIREVVAAAHAAVHEAPRGALRVGFQVNRVDAGVITAVPLLIEIGPGDDGRSEYTIMSRADQGHDLHTPLELFVFDLHRGYRRALLDQRLTYGDAMNVLHVLFAALDYASELPDAVTGEAGFTHHLQARISEEENPSVACELAKVLRLLESEHAAAAA